MAACAAACAVSGAILVAILINPSLSGTPHGNRVAGRGVYVFNLVGLTIVCVVSGYWLVSEWRHKKITVRESLVFDRASDASCKLGIAGARDLFITIDIECEEEHGAEAFGAILWKGGVAVASEAAEVSNGGYCIEIEAKGTSIEDYILEIHHKAIVSNDAIVCNIAIRGNAPQMMLDIVP